MKHSTDRILTSHAGSLPRPQALIEVNQAKLEGRALDEKTYEARLQQAVEDACRKQAVRISLQNVSSSAPAKSPPTSLPMCRTPNNPSRSRSRWSCVLLV